MTAYYNEIDPNAAAWLGELIRAGHIAEGVVDTRSICDVDPIDIRGFTQCHFFAGIGVWSYALRRAGWGDDLPVWTGSCPCQPFSSAGKKKGFKDERHLWPEFFRLIRECRPVACFGEQVAGKNGEAWLDLVSADMEGEGYTIGAVSAPSCGLGAPHKRQRLYWVADDKGAKCSWPTKTGLENNGPTDSSASSQLSDNTGEQIYEEQQRPQAIEGKWGANVSRGRSLAGPVNGFWGDAEWVWCKDEKYRPVEPGTFPLAYGSPARVVRLRGYGNAIVAEQAKEFIRAYLEIAKETSMLIGHMLIRHKHEGDTPDA